MDFFERFSNASLPDSLVGVFDSLGNQRQQSRNAATTIYGSGCIRLCFEVLRVLAKAFESFADSIAFKLNLLIDLLWGCQLIIQDSWDL